MTVDTKALADVISKCFSYATDGRVERDQQAMFLADGKRLRGLLMNLLSAKFDEGTKAVEDANKQLATLNDKLADPAQVLANAAQTLTNITTVVGALDKLLNVAASFI